MGKLSRQRERELKARFKVNIMPLIALIRDANLRLFLSKTVYFEPK